MSLKLLQTDVDQWIKAYGVRYFNVTTNTLLLNEEVGEFSRLIARVYGEQSFKNPVSAEEQKKMITDELSDILFVLSCLANQMDIDLDEAMKSNLAKKTNRDSTRHKNNDKLSS